MDTVLVRLIWKAVPVHAVAAVFNGEVLGTSRAWITFGTSSAHQTPRE